MKWSYAEVETNFIMNSPFKNVRSNVYLTNKISTSQKKRHNKFWGCLIFILPNSFSSDTCQEKLSEWWAQEKKQWESVISVRCTILTPYMNSFCQQRARFEVLMKVSSRSERWKENWLWTRIENLLSSKYWAQEDFVKDKVQSLNHKHEAGVETNRMKHLKLKSKISNNFMDIC